MENIERAAAVVRGYLDWLEAGGRGSAEDYLREIERDADSKRMTRLRGWLEVNLPSTREHNITKDMLWNMLRTIEEIVKED